MHVWLIMDGFKTQTSRGRSTQRERREDGDEDEDEGGRRWIGKTSA